MKCIHMHLNIFYIYIYYIIHEFLPVSLIFNYDIYTILVGTVLYIVCRLNNLKNINNYFGYLSMTLTLIPPEQLYLFMQQL